jgi:hypothetical protein
MAAAKKIDVVLRCIIVSAKCSNSRQTRANELSERSTHVQVFIVQE